MDIYVHIYIYIYMCIYIDMCVCVHQNLASENNNYQKHDVRFTTKLYSISVLSYFSRKIVNIYDYVFKHHELYVFRLNPQHSMVNMVN